MAELKISLLAGQESKQFLMELTKQIDRLSDLVLKLNGVNFVESEKEYEAPENKVTAEVEDDEDFAPKKSVKKKAAAVDFDEETETEEAAEEVEEEFTAPPAATKKKKAKLPTLDDVNDACKAYAKVHTRDGALAVLKKKFKTATVSTLVPEQYQACIEAMAIDQ